MSINRLAKAESAIRVVLKFNEYFNRHDVSNMMQLMSSDCTFESFGPSPDGDVYSGADAIRQFWDRFFSQSPNAHIEIEEIYGFGDRCVMRWKYSWVDDTGIQSHIRGVDIFREKNDLICEKFSYVKG